MEIKKISIDLIEKFAMSESFPNGLEHIKSLPYMSIVQATEGSYSISINSSAPEMTGEGGFFIAPSQAVQTIVHIHSPMTHRMLARWIFLNVKVNDEYSLDEIMDFPTVLHPQNADLLDSLFSSLFASDNVCDEMSIAYQIVKLLISVSSPKSPISNTAVLCALRYIHENYKSNISISALAEATHTSQSYLYSAFKKHVGSSPIAYLNHYRMTLASDMLKHSSTSIADIAAAVGFDDQFYFSKLFKKHFNVSPREYRRII